MLNEHFYYLTEIRNRLVGERAVIYRANDTTATLDAILALLKHAAEQDARLQEHLNEHEGIRKKP